MQLTTQTKRVIIAVIIGIVLGILLSTMFGYWIWFPLMIGVCFIFSLFCKSAPDITEN